MNTKIQRFLAWDTSSATGVVSAFEIEDGKLREVVAWSLSLETSRHSERLLWSVDTVLQSAGWKLKDLSGIAVGVGPGSFTGLRIGVTTARMLASTLKIPVIPLSSLAMLAKNATNALITLEGDEASENTLVIACTDATKGEWFTLMGTADSIAEGMGEGKGISESVLPPDEILEKIEKALVKMGKGARWVAIGQSTERYPDVWKLLPEKSRILLPESKSVHQVHPEVLTRLAFRAILENRSHSASSLVPRYLRESEAQVKLKKGLLQANPLLPRKE